MLALLTCGLLAWQAGVEAAPLETLEGLVAESGSEPYWLSYQIDADRELGFACCFRNGHFNRPGNKGLARPGRCRPDAKNRSWSTWHDDDFLEGDFSDPDLSADRLRVLLRVKDGEVERIQAYSPGCQLDFENRVEEIKVETKASLAFFARLAAQAATGLASGAGPGSGPEHRLEMIHATLGRHADPAADRIMADLAGNLSSSLEARRSAIFWLGQTRGAFAVKALRSLLDLEPEKELKEHIVFSLSQTHTPDNQGAMELIRLLKETSNPELRRQALFWLGSSRDPRALDLLAEVLR